MEWSQFLGIFNIIIIDLILSGDNAVVIGMAARSLPVEQRKKAIMFGAGAAIVLRASLTMIATWLLHIPLLMTIGGLLLLWIAVKLQQDEEGPEVQAGTDLRSAIKTIIVADVVMSLDNVLAVAGVALGDLWLVLFGLVFSIPIIMWGSGLIAKLLNKFPWFVFLGAAILGYTSGELITEDRVLAHYLIQGQPLLEKGIPILLAIGVVLVGFVLRNRHNKQHLT
ncbi:TerC family protein [Risungbinella massiliensis]|uniref:TerC family protein n=1 Tax=Risungbinella massiliensis TaxID=1329796 RepID=UPI0005CC8A73|nr:TerC family protein [Risungbinella massiliensis]